MVLVWYHTFVTVHIVRLASAVAFVVATAAAAAAVVALVVLHIEVVVLFVELFAGAA